MRRWIIVLALLVMPTLSYAICCDEQIRDDPGNWIAKTKTVSWFGRVPLPDDFKPTSPIQYALSLPGGAKLFVMTLSEKALSQNGKGWCLSDGKKKLCEQFEMKPHNTMWRVSLSSAGVDMSKIPTLPCPKMTSKKKPLPPGQCLKLDVSLVLNGVIYCTRTLWRQTVNSEGFQEVDMFAMDDE